MHLRTPFLLLVAAIIAAPHQPLNAQVATANPPVLYSDRNEITITDREGIREIIAVGGPLVRVEGAGPGSCDQIRRLDVFVNTASQPVSLAITVIDCKGIESRLTIPFATVWTLDINSLGVTQQGQEVCKSFSVRAMGSEPIILDNITVDDPGVSLRLPTSLPIAIPGSDAYVYTVCHDAREIGEFTFPVTTWIRRDFPSAGMTSYPVADTGRIRVVPGVEEPLSDPTTFRSVGIPNGVIPKRGRLYVGVYDVLGVTAGYSFDDHFMVIVGGALPTPDDWSGINGEIFGAYSFGVKIGVQPKKELHVAAGYQYGRSIYDQASTPDRESEIRVHAPYVAASWGDDDRRVSVTGGYALKRHATLSPVTVWGQEEVQEYDRNAWFAGVGGDWRIGRHWKVVAEVATMETAGVVPVVVGMRYFGRSWAVDAGVGYVGIVTDGASRPRVPLVPLLSALFVFGK